MPQPDRQSEGGDALVHLRVPAALKGRWVRESRAAGMRLTDWIISRVEAPVPSPITICIPADLDFAALKLARDPDGSISFDTSVIECIALASGLDAEFFMTQPEDAVSAVITQWYRSHILAGGAPDPVQEDLIAEARIEDERGGGISHQPGRA